MLEVRAENQIDTRRLIQITSADHFAREMDHMTECVLRDEKPRTPGEEGLRDMILIEAIYKAVKDRRTVSVRRGYTCSHDLCRIAITGYRPAENPVTLHASHRCFACDLEHFPLRAVKGST